MECLVVTVTKKVYHKCTVGSGGSLSLIRGVGGLGKSQTLSGKMIGVAAVEKHFLSPPFLVLGKA